MSDIDLLTGQAYLQSARIAQVLEPFEGYAGNRDPMLNVITMHREAAYRIDREGTPGTLRGEATSVWDQAYEWGKEHGYRNAQVTVLAPTGTIGFMMDCDTTGIEPDIALVKYKKLVGGGVLKIVNMTVPAVLDKLGYTKDERESIVQYIDRNDTIEGAPGLKNKHLPIFDCAFKPAKGETVHPPHGASSHDGRGPALPLRRHLENRQYAPRGDCRRH